MESTTVFDATIGGLAIGLAVAVDAVLLGRITCINDILGGLVSFDQSWLWRVSFQLGLMVGAFMLKKSFPYVWTEPLAQVSLWKLAIAGFILGCGSCLQGGSFSGHVFCGLSRRSQRSIVSVSISSLVAFAVYWLTGGGFKGVGLIAVSLEDIFVLRVDSLKLFFTCIKPVFIGLVGVIFVSVKGMTRTVPILKVLLPLVVGAYAGYLFAMGIGFSGMLFPDKWLGLWNIPSRDPTLLFCMFPALLVSFTCFRLLSMEDNRPILYRQHYIPRDGRIDWQVVVGSVLFGSVLGWLGMIPETVWLQLLGNPYSVGVRVGCGGMLIGMLLPRWLLAPLIVKEKHPTTTATSKQRKG